MVLERWGGGMRGFVFGTLLGPEATGPGRGCCGFGRGGSLSGLFVSGFPAVTFRAPVVGVWGVWCGVVV